MSAIAPDLCIATWRKSTHSENDGGCVEIAEQFPGVMPIRDSKAPALPPIIIPRAAWSSFVATLAARPPHPVG